MKKASYLFMISNCIKSSNGIEKALEEQRSVLQDMQNDIKKPINKLFNLEYKIESLEKKTNKTESDIRLLNKLKKKYSDETSLDLSIGKRRPYMKSEIKKLEKYLKKLKEDQSSSKIKLETTNKIIKSMEKEVKNSKK